MRHCIFIMAALLLLSWAGCGSEGEELSPTERQRLSVHPRAAQFLVQAQQAFDAGVFNTALVLADSAGRYAPELADVYFLRARILTELQRPELAEAAYSRVLDLDPSYRGVRLNLGNSALRRGEYARALALYRQELDRHPSAEVWLMMGRTYEQQRVPDSARYAYEQVIGLDSSSAEAYLRLGQLYKDRGELDKAVAVSRKGMRLEPGNLNHQYALGALLVLTGQAEEAAGYLQAVVAARPWHYWANYNLGKALVHLGRSDEAQPYFEAAKRLQDHLSEIDYWQILAQNNPDQFMLWVKLADALRRSGRSEEALAANRVALSLAPRYMVYQVGGQEASARNLLAGREMMGGNVDGAIEHYHAFLAREADHPDLWLNLGVLYAASGRVEEARRAWETVLRHAPNHQGARMLLMQLAQTYRPPER